MNSLVFGLDEQTRRRASALSDPTRFSIFGFIAKAPGPVTVAELTEFVGLNHNAVRQHLALLVSAGLVEEAVATTSTRGRPKLNYTPAPAAAADAMLSYRRLAVLLVKALSKSLSPREVGRVEGRRVAAEISGDGRCLSVPEVVNLAMVQWGFATRLDSGENDAKVTLTSCPLVEAVDFDPGVVCALHLGIVEGILEETAGETLVRFEVRNPRVEDCEIVLVGGPPNREV